MADNIMLDLETMGVGVHAPLWQIGAVCFNSDGLGSTIRIDIDLVDVLLLTDKNVQGETIAWWRQQEMPKRGMVYGLKEGLVRFTDWLRENTNSGTFVWANSPAFDCVILADHYRQAGLSVPWSYKQERDMRTAISLMDSDHEFKPDKFSGQKHDALDDACYQAAWVKRIMYDQQT